MNARRLPPLTALRAFEAAARHLSFKHAANELSLTPTAISHQVRQLEDHLGVRLFARGARRVDLTPAGQGCSPLRAVILSTSRASPGGWCPTPPKPWWGIATGWWPQANVNPSVPLGATLMAVTQIADVVVPAEFTSYVVQNTMERTALFQSGVAVRNGEIEALLSAGADMLTVPHWNDLGNEEANIVNDNPADESTPYKINAGKQIVRKSFLHNSWSAMNLASELSGDNALPRIQERVTAYWDRQMQRRLVASLNGILADNIANDGGDMVRSIAADMVGAITANTRFNATGRDRGHRHPRRCDAT
nr:LysR family transcriptional regulator [Lysobacter changpingensis]